MAICCVVVAITFDAHTSNNELVTVDTTICQRSLLGAACVYCF